MTANQNLSAGNDFEPPYLTASNKSLGLVCILTMLRRTFLLFLHQADRNLYFHQLILADK